MRRPRRSVRLMVAAGLVAWCVPALVLGCFDPERIHIEPDGWESGRDVADGTDDSDSPEVTAPPPNDTCAGAIDLGQGGVFSGDTRLAGDDHEPAAGCGRAGGRDVWFRFTLDATEVVYLDTVDGNAWDSVLDLRRGSCSGAGSLVLCADDRCAGESGGRRSQLVDVLDAGQYLVVVDGGDSTAAGPFALRFQRAACADARRLAGNGEYDGDTTGWGDRYRASCAESGVPDATYYFGLCGPREVTVSTCNSTTRCDSILAFAAGGCGAADEIACDDDDDTCRFGMRLSTVTAILPQGLNFLIVESRLPSGPYRLMVSGM